MNVMIHYPSCKSASHQIKATKNPLNLICHLFYVKKKRKESKGYAGGLEATHGSFWGSHLKTITGIHNLMKAKCTTNKITE